MFGHLRHGASRASGCRAHRGIAVGTDLLSLNVGLAIPTLFEHAAINKFTKTKMKEIFKDKKVALFAMPGIATDVCEKQQLPSYLENADWLKEKGIEDIVCVLMNDPYTMYFWYNTRDPKGKLTFYSDPDGSFTEAMGKTVDLTAALLGKRSHRYSLVADNGVVTHLFEEEHPADFKVSGAETMVQAL